MPAFLCPHCAQRFEAPTEWAGRFQDCPHCRRPVRVPAARSGVAGEEATATLVQTLLRPPEGPGELGRLGSHRVQKILAVSGLSVVFQAESLESGEPVALKVLLPALLGVTDHRERFLREARILAGLSSRHVVRLLQVSEDRDVPYMALELLYGETLARRLERVGRLPVREVLRTGREAAEGLAAVHAQGVVHRDINPANLWIETPSGRVVILDFNLALSFEGEEAPLQGVLAGTPLYMAPEQANNKPLDPHSDLFSLGCVLYQMCTGEAPFRRPDTLATLLAITLKDPRPLEEINPEVPPALAQLVRQLLEKDPADRPASARAVADALAAIERGA